jgi:hypothetical protein
VLTMEASAAAQVLGRTYLQKKTIEQRELDGASLDVVAVNLRHAGLEKLKARLSTIRIEAGIA